MAKPIKYPKVHARLVKLGRQQDYKLVYYRIKNGMNQEEALKYVIENYFHPSILPKKSLNIEYLQKQNFAKQRYYTTDEEIERQILFDNKILTYSLDELSEQEKQLIK